MLREWKTNYGKLPEDAMFLSLISQTLIHQILLLDLPKIQKDELNKLIGLAISANFTKIRQIANNKLNLISSFNEPTSNLAEDSVPKEKIKRNQPDTDNNALYSILDTLHILQNE